MQSSAMSYPKAPVPANASFNAIGQIIQFINRTPDGYVTAENLLLSSKFRIFSLEQLRTFVKANEDNLLVANKKRPLSSDDIIWVKTALALCEVYCRKRQTCVGNCGGLHICRTFLLKGGTFCPFNQGGKGCRFGHNLNTPHNKRLLRAHNLECLDSGELQLLFRRRTCRSISTMPQVCLYYNDRRGNRCSNKSCKSLHFCLDQIRGMCLGLCNKDHTMSTQHNEIVLHLFAIDWSVEALVSDLREVMEHRRVSDNNSHYSGSVHDSDQDDLSSDEDSEESGGVQSLRRARVASGLNVSGADGTCCRECKGNKALIQKLQDKVSRLEADVREMKVDFHDSYLNPSLTSFVFETQSKYFQS